jgi:hypothetical protein
MHLRIPDATPDVLSKQPKLLGLFVNTGIFYIITFAKPMEYTNQMHLLVLFSKKIYVV